MFWYEQAYTEHSENTLSDQVTNYFKGVNISHSDHPWRKVLENGTPHKLACVTWLGAKEACLTKHNLQSTEKGNVPITDVLCMTVYEDAYHLFIHCKLINWIWSMLLDIFEAKWTMPKTIREILISWTRGGIWLSSKFKYHSSIVWWMLYSERNH